VNQYDSIPGSDSTKFPDVSVLSKHYRSYSARLTGVTQCGEKATLTGVTLAQYCSVILFRRIDAASWRMESAASASGYLICVYLHRTPCTNRDASYH